MRTSCRFAMAVHVLAVLAYKDGDRVTSSLLAGSVNTNPVVIRRLLLALQRAKLVETRKGAGLGSRLPEFIPSLEEEFHGDVRSLLSSAVSDGRVNDDARPLADRDLEGLIGWMLQRA